MTQPALPAGGSSQEGRVIGVSTPMREEVRAFAESCGLGQYPRRPLQSEAASDQGEGMKLAAMLRTVALVTLLTGMTACSSMAPKIQTPRLTIVKVAMTSGDIFSQNFLVQLNVQNPNAQELPIKGIEYQLFLQRDSFAEGTNSRPFTVPANGETEFDMTVRTNFVSSIGRLLTRLNGKTTVEYVFEGKVRLDAGMIRTLPFQESGTVDLATRY